MNLLVSMGVVDNPATEAIPTTPPGDVWACTVAIAIVAVLVLVIVIPLLMRYINRLKKQIKKLQVELEEAKKQQAIIDYNSSNPESTRRK